jgi:hypothetical protein
MRLRTLRVCVWLACAACCFGAPGAAASPTQRFVVGPDVTPDGVDTFGALSTALTTAGLASGAVIQIEPSAIVSSVSNSAFATAQASATGGFTIRGNPSAGAGETGLIVLRDVVTISAPNVRFENVNLRIETAGRLIATGSDFAIEGSVVLAERTASDGTIALGGASGVVASSRISTAPGISQTVRVQDGSTGAAIRDNVFTSSNAVNFVQFDATATPMGAVVERNTFHGNTGIASTAAVHVNQSRGVAIRDNDFIDTDSGFIVISVSTGSQEIVLERNRIRFSDPSTTGISVSGGSPGLATSVEILGNDVSGVGTGLSIGAPASGTFIARIEGNRFEATTGVAITSAGVSLADVDLGGGSQGSLGGNDFTAFTDPALITVGAIRVGTAGGPVTARGNVFAGDPETVIFDVADEPSRIDVDASDALTGNAAFVARLYAFFLGRAADLADAGDAGAVLAALDGGRKASEVVRGVVRSEESLEAVVDRAYRAVLGRSATPEELASAIAGLAKKKKEEELVAALLSSAEARGTLGSDGAFVARAYALLLQRLPTEAETAAGAAAAAKGGKARLKAVRAILKSGDFTAARVAAATRALLRREPTPDEIAKLRKLDRLSLVTAIAASDEFRGGP